MKLKNSIIYLLLITFSLTMIFPVYILVKVSLSAPKEVNTAHPTFLIHHFTLSHWKDILMSDEKTDTGLSIYHIKGKSYTFKTESGKKVTLKPNQTFVLNGVFKSITLQKNNKEYKMSLDQLTSLRQHIKPNKVFLGTSAMKNLIQPLWKSFFVATITTILAIIIAAPSSYVISRMPKSVKYLTILGLLVTRMFPDVGIALPIASRFLSWGLIDTKLGLILAHLIPNLPFLAWILVGTFEVIPKDLEESAMIDGTNRLGALRRIIFPVALPGIAVGAIFIWLNSWNEFIYARYLSTVSSTLPLKIFEVITRGDIFSAAAYSTVLTIPVIIITFYLQTHMKSNMLSGSVKG